MALYNDMEAGNESSFGADIVERRRKFRPAPEKTGELYDDTKIVASKNDGGNPRAASSAMGNSGMASAQTAINGGSGADIAASGMMASGNPYAMAGGLGLAVLSANKKQKQEQENAKAQYENQRIQNQQSALSNMMQVAEGLRRL